jgi:DNA-binding NarL/FixJ family response regulator
MHGSSERLTEREREVMCLLAKGLQNKEIAARLDPVCRPETVKTHLRVIFAKLGVENRTEAVIAWIQLGGARTGTAEEE